MLAHANLSEWDVSGAVLRFHETNGPNSIECIRNGLGEDEHRCKFALAWLMYRELVAMTDDNVFTSLTGSMDGIRTQSKVVTVPKVEC